MSQKKVSVDFSVLICYPSGQKFPCLSQKSEDPVSVSGTTKQPKAVSFGAGNPADIHAKGDKSRSLLGLVRGDHPNS